MSGSELTGYCKVYFQFTLVFMRAILTVELRTMFLASQPHPIAEGFAQPLSFWAAVYKLQNALRGKATLYSLLCAFFLLAFFTLAPWYLSIVFKQMFHIFFPVFLVVSQEGRIHLQ